MFSIPEGVFTEYFMARDSADINMIELNRENGRAFVYEQKEDFFLKKKLFLLIIAGAAIFGLYYAFFSQKIDTVSEGKIYRSAQLSDNSLERLLREKGIKTIINLRGTPQNAPWYLKESETAQKYNAKLHDIKLDPHDLPKYLNLIKIINILSTDEKPILIHCLQGVDRTGMVSALALAIDKNPPLPELKKQFSLRYRIFPFYRSIGPYFFSQYELWLKKNQKIHSRENLLYWIKHEYIDSQGNVEFWIDHIDGKELKSNKILIAGAPENIIIDGWAFDARTCLPAQGFNIVIDNRVSLKADFVTHRPDVAKFFNLGEEYHQKFVAGWTASIEKSALGAGCHSLSVKIVKGRSQWEIPTEYMFCL
jgi:protein tyrosine phosphatase (PTP) superfamily phosphohydrolase (DUF442 family)